MSEKDPNKKCGLCVSFDICDVEKKPFGKVPGTSINQGVCRNPKVGGISLRIRTGEDLCVSPENFTPRVSL